MPKNFCINERDPESITDKEYLKAFAEGPCNPTLVLPGLLSTKLVVTIDCEELRSKNPRIFRECGWNACQKSWYHVRKIHKKINLKNPLKFG